MSTYDKAQKNRLLVELDEFGDENATMYVEALDGEQVKLLRVIYKMLKKQLDRA